MKGRRLIGYAGHSGIYMGVVGAIALLNYMHGPTSRLLEEGFYADTTLFESSIYLHNTVQQHTGQLFYNLILI